MTFEEIVTAWLDRSLEDGEVETCDLGWIRLKYLKVGMDVVAPESVRIVYDGRSEMDDVTDDEQQYSFAVYVSDDDQDEVCVWGWVSPDGAVCQVSVSEIPDGAYEKFEAIAKSIWEKAQE